MLQAQLTERLFDILQHRAAGEFAICGPNPSIATRTSLQRSINFAQALLLLHALQATPPTS